MQVPTSPKDDGVMTGGKVETSELRLPTCPLPRPGEQVHWFAGQRPISGTVTGYTGLGSALVHTMFGHGIRKSFTEIRLKDPFNRIGPNWSRLPAPGRILRPVEDVTLRLETLLNRKMPPGIRYIDLITEIWSRGFEVFLVGGTVRDAITGMPSKDIDLVTTMPIRFAKPFIRSMFNYDPSDFAKRGYIRIGGTPESKDPFIDLKAFSDSLSGTSEATFGVGFDRDIVHRDFACNAIYYDPINKVLIDPCGYGIRDAIDRRLTFICNTNDPQQYAQIFIRALKFHTRGFNITPELRLLMGGVLADSLPAMQFDFKVRYVRTQILSKCATKDDHKPALEAISAILRTLELDHIWVEHFHPILGVLLDA